MSPAEAHELLQAIRATWPRRTVDEHADRLWLTDLADLANLDAAWQAFRLFRRGSRYAPSPAEFLVCYRQQVARRASSRLEVEQRAQRRPDAAERARVAELLVGIRATLADAKGRLDRYTPRPAPYTKTMPPPPPGPELPFDTPRGTTLATADEPLEDVVDLGAWSADAAADRDRDGSA